MEKKFKINKNSKLLMKKIVGYTRDPFTGHQLPVFEWEECIQDLELGSLMKPNKTVVQFKYDIPKKE